MSKNMLVISMAKWVFEDFAAANDGSYVIRHDYGLGLPPLESQEIDAIWTPAAHAARLFYAGYFLPLESTGHNWLDSVNTKYTQREVITTDASTAIPGEGFWKLAEAKHESFEAGWRSEQESREFLNALPADAHVQYSNRYLDIKQEQRYFISPQGIRGCIYKEGDWIYYSDLQTRHVTQADLDFVSAFLRERKETTTSWVLDVAVLQDGSRAILESNPVWSSGIYSIDPIFVMDAIAASMRDPKKLWQPDAFLQQIAKRKQLLS